MGTLKYIVDKFNLSAMLSRNPIEIPNVGRDDLARLFHELSFKSGAEIGVELGYYTEVLGRENPAATIYGVDAWRVYSGYRDHVSQEKLTGFYQAARDRLTPHGNVKLIRKFSRNAIKDFEKATLDFVYIDANHELPFVINDIIEWSDKVRPGGIVSGHDYRESKRLVSNNHVVHAVNAYTGAYRIQPWFLLGTKEIVEGETRDKPRSWMWVKL